MRANALTRTSHPPILRWVFRRDDMGLICRVDRQASGRYAVVIIPQGAAPASSGRVIIYNSELEAITQHAAITAALRDLGWKLAEHTRTSDRPTALRTAA